MAKPQIKKVKKDSKGVTYYFSDDDGIMCVDIDVEPGVKSVVFSGKTMRFKVEKLLFQVFTQKCKEAVP